MCSVNVQAAVNRVRTPALTDPARPGPARPVGHPSQIAQAPRPAPVLTTALQPQTARAPRPAPVLPTALQPRLAQAPRPAPVLPTALQPRLGRRVPIVRIPTPVPVLVRAIPVALSVDRRLGGDRRPAPAEERGTGHGMSIVQAGTDQRPFGITAICGIAVITVVGGPPGRSSG